MDKTLLFLIFFLFTSALIIYFLIFKNKRPPVEIEKEPTVFEDFSVMDKKVTTHRSIEEIALSKNSESILEKYKKLNRPVEEIEEIEETLTKENEPKELETNGKETLVEEGKELKEEIEEPEEENKPKDLKKQSHAKNKKLSKINLQDAVVHSAIIQRKKFR